MATAAPWRLIKRPSTLIAGELAGVIGGELAGEIGGELAGEIGGELAGEIAGEIAGAIEFNPCLMRTARPPAWPSRPRVSR